MSKTRKYSLEFNRGDIEQARQAGIICVQLSPELGFNANLLTFWKREADINGGITVILRSDRGSQFRNSDYQRFYI